MDSSQISRRAQLSPATFDLSEIKVSALMCVFNGKRFLAEAIDSILSQKWSEFELVIVDDGSTDSTAEILSAYTDPRVVLIKNPRNLGLVASLNRGLAVARGEYIARQDADDISCRERISDQVQFLEQHKNVAVIGTDYVEVHTDPA